MAQASVANFIDLKKDKLPTNEGAEKLSVQHIAFRLTVVEKLLDEGLFRSVDALRPLLESNNYSLTSKSHLAALLPLVLERELSRLVEINYGCPFSLIVDEKTYQGTLVAVNCEIITENLDSIIQCIALTHLSQSPNAEQLAATINEAMVRIRLEPKNFFHLKSDSASVPSKLACY